MPTTKLYRVALIIVNGAAAALGALTAYGPGLGISLEMIGAITSAVNIAIVLLRQILDPATPTLPSNGPVTLPPPGPTP